MSLSLTITWYAQSAFRLELDGLTIYHDPFRILDGQPYADLILISHEHFDHCSPEDTAKIRTKDTIVITNPTAAQASGMAGPIRQIRPGEVIRLERVGQKAVDLEIRAVPAYNVNKFRSPGVPFHPREREHVGFVCRVGNVSWYFAGDTDVIPEMSSVGPVDYAFLPVSGTYVMTAEEAVEAVRLLQPRVVIPMHYGAVVGSVEDAKRFAALARHMAEVRILEPYGHQV